MLDFPILDLLTHCLTLAIGMGIGAYLGTQDERARWHQYADKVNSLREQVLSYFDAQENANKAVSAGVSTLQAGLQGLKPGLNKPNKFKHGSN